MDEIILKDLEKRISNHSILNTSLESFNLMYDLLKYNLDTLKKLDELGNLIIKGLYEINDKIITEIRERT